MDSLLHSIPNSFLRFATHDRREFSQRQPLFRIIPIIDSLPTIAIFGLAMSDSAKATKPDQALNDRLHTSGFRFTPQRQQVYNVLIGTRDHPTADQVFIRVKQAMPEISMATVYNCLDALVKSGVVRQVNLDRAAARFCPNMMEHCHFHCSDCGKIFDIDLDGKPTVPEARLPRGFKPEQIEISMRGHCPDRDCQTHHKN